MWCPNSVNFYPCGTPVPVSLCHSDSAPDVVNSIPNQSSLARSMMAAYYVTPSSSVVAHTSALQPYGQYSELGRPNVSVYDLPTDSENEAEVDELESDTDPEDELAASASANHKKSGRRLGERAPGTTLLPAAKVENMVQADSASNQIS